VVLLVMVMVMVVMVMVVILEIKKGGDEKAYIMGNILHSVNSCYTL
jgi:preprotein translocase subunit SecG